jgi:hypothetical protein
MSALYPREGGGEGGMSELYRRDETQDPISKCENGGRVGYVGRESEREGEG